jgi:OOP family OmpA-OmpF porin
MRVRVSSVCAAIACLALPFAAFAEMGSVPTAPEACGCFGPASMRDGDGDGVPDRVDHCVNTPAGCQVDPWGCSTDADGDGVCDGVDKCPNTPAGERADAKGCSQSQRTLNSQQAPPPPPAPQAQQIAPATPAPAPASKPVSEMERQLVEGGRIRLENVYFETNSANLLPESEATLDEAGRTLEKFPNLKIEVQGHTDTRGSDAHNMRLSQARAESVRKYLLDHFQLGTNKYVAKGYGETEPETRERNDEELLRNRRVVLNVLNPEDLPHGVKVENKP